MKKKLFIGAILAAFLVLSTPLISGGIISSDAEKEANNFTNPADYCDQLKKEIEDAVIFYNMLQALFAIFGIDISDMVNSRIEQLWDQYYEICGESSTSQDSASALKELENTILEAQQSLNLLATRYSSNILITQQIQEINSASNQILNTISGVTVSESSVSGQCPLCALSR